MGQIGVSRARHIRYTRVASNWVDFVNNDDKAKHLDTKTNRHLTMRFFKYLLLGVLTIVIPYLTTMILIIVTGDRYEGMKLAVTPGLILAQLLFGLIFIKRPWLTKIPMIVLATALAYGLVVLITKTELIKTTFDLYGFWDLAVTNFIAGLITWELFYHVDSTVNKSTTTVK